MISLFKETIIFCSLAISFSVIGKYTKFKICDVITEMAIITLSIVSLES